MATGRPEVTVILSADDQDLSQDLDKAEGKMTRFGKSGMVALAAVTAAVIAAVAAFKKMIDTLNQLEELYKIQRNAERQLEATIKATGWAAGYSADELKAYAQELQDLTNFADEETLPAMAKLITFNKITGETFKRAMRAAQDLAAAGFGNLEGNVIQLGKALQDPIKGISALSRNGISFTAAEQDMIRALVESNRLLDAQSTILAAIEGQVQGTAMAVADAGIQMENALGDVGERVGELWNAFKEPVIEDFLRRMNEGAGSIEERFDLLSDRVRAFSQTMVDIAGTSGAEAPGFGTVGKNADKLNTILMAKVNPALAGTLSLTKMIGKWMGEDLYEANLENLRLERERLKILEERERKAAELAAEEKRREQEAQEAVDRLFSRTAEIGAVELPLIQVESLDKYEKAAERAASRFKSADKALQNYLSRNSGFNASIQSLTGMYNRMATAAASRRPEDRQLAELKERRREAERQHKETKTELEKQTAALAAITIESDGPRFVPGA